MRWFAGLLCVSAIVISSCTGAAPAATVSAAPSPTPTAEARAATATTSVESASPAPLTEATEPIVLEPPHSQPTATLAPPPLHLPDSPITIFEPGPGSQVRSPFRVIGHGGPSFEERVQVRLLGEDGRSLDETTTILFAYPGNAGRFVSRLSFETQDVGELGTLQIDTFERRYGNLAQRRSQELVLLSAGSARVRPGHHGPAQLALTAPEDGAVVPMGAVELSGGGWSTGHGPIVVQAYDRSGDLVASAPVQLDTAEPGAIDLFSGQLEVRLPASQYGRLAVAELAEPGGQPRFLFSIEVYFER